MFYMKARPIIRRIEKKNYAKKVIFDINYFYFIKDGLVYFYDERSPKSISRSCHTPEQLKAKVALDGGQFWFKL
jgi:hypothetical protein